MAVPMPAPVEAVAGGCGAAVRAAVRLDRPELPHDPCWPRPLLGAGSRWVFWASLGRPVVGRPTGVQGGLGD